MNLYRFNPAPPVTTRLDARPPTPTVCRMAHEFSDADARAYVDANIERWCAEQGITVAITDPSLIAYATQMLRVGKERADAVRVEARGSATGRANLHAHHEAA